MRRIFPAPTCEQAGGFSLVEVVVALAVVALSVAAVATSIMTSAKIEASARFYQQARLSAESVQLHAYQLLDDPDLTGIEQERISQDPQGKKLDWTLYTIRSRATDRRVVLAFKSQ